MKKRISFVAENVRVRASRIISVRLMNRRTFFFLFVRRWELLARSDTGRSQKLRINRGLLILSLERIILRLEFFLGGVVKISVLSKNRMEVWEMEMDQIFCGGQAHKVAVMPRVVKIKVNI